jgi:ribonuclease Z
MHKITFLGTASAVPNKNQQNTSLLIQSEGRVILVDCPGNPFVRLDQAHIEPSSITDLILTHFHPDHVSGLPLLLMDLWLTNRTVPLVVYGLPEVLEKSNKLMALFAWEDWEGFYPIEFHELPKVAKHTLIEFNALKILSSPVRHFVPTVGIRIESGEKSICYSSDTAPCDAVVDLARGCDTLIHEATGEADGDIKGHSSAADAGKIAQMAGVHKLYLIHYPINSKRSLLIKEAKAHFEGEVVAAEDLMVLEIS